MFGDIANNTKFTESAKVLDACTFIPEGYYGPFDYRNQRREPWQIFGKGITLLWLLRTVLNIYFFVSTLRYVSANWRAIDDRASIEAWLARGKTTSPTTGAPLEHTHLTPNHLVKSMIAEYQESKG